MTRQRFMPVMGDSNSLHDASGLGMPLERNSRCRVIVLDDQGGLIFKSLEHGQRVSEAVYERYWSRLKYSHCACSGRMGRRFAA